MKLYIDRDYNCHTSNPDGAYIAVETDAFNNKCTAYIEGYRYIPDGETWTHPDGVVFHGEMIAPRMDWRALDTIQREYERDQLVAYELALSEIEAALGVSG